MSETNCNIIKDLLPLYCDGICTEESRVLVDEHIKDCAECASELQKIREMPNVVQADGSVDEPIKKAGKRIKKLKKKSVIKAVAISCAVALLLGSLTVLQLVLNNSKKVYYQIFQECEYDPNFSWENNGNGKIAMCGLKINLPDGYSSSDFNFDSFENGCVLRYKLNSDKSRAYIIGCDVWEPTPEEYYEYYNDGIITELLGRIVDMNLQKLGYTGFDDPHIHSDIRNPRKAPHAGLFSLPTTKIKAASYFMFADVCLPIYPSGGKFITYECEDYIAYGGYFAKTDENLDSVCPGFTIEVVPTGSSTFYTLFAYGFNKTEILQILSSITIA